MHLNINRKLSPFSRVEYELLRKALAVDQNVPYKPQKVKKPKKKKGKKKKKPVDPTGDRTLSSLYNELKDEGVIEEVSHKDFDEFISDFNFTADDTRDEDNLT